METADANSQTDKKSKEYSGENTQEGQKTVLESKKILADSKKSAETLENYSEGLKADFGEKGFSITGLSYGIEKLQDAFIYKHGGLNKEGGGAEAKAETSELLRAVKVLLGNVNMVLSA